MNRPEESSWTSYFEEFLCQKNDDHDQDMIMNSCDHETLNSIVSDAASIVKKAVCIRDDDDHYHAKKLRLINKRKNKGSVIMIDDDDDSLEDTASSPVNSPKEKVGTCEEENKRKVLNPNMELKKRGLCLVPLSSLANYLS
ncbi:hypothetical protein L6452_39916 [Arctium lappa]|uniref:Uncharacterized protein n=1 Tax=Arctium lappa TaxID=4217 RepID=A0ACB8XUB8_ARCLA|nr:hypothetical protein L6452_39916 [Arctium lappa]